MGSQLIRFQPNLLSVWMRPTRLCCKSYAGKLPSCLGGEEVAIGRADMPGRRYTRAAAQNHLPAHEFAVVLAERAIQWLEAGKAEVGTAGPHPTVPIILRTVLALGEFGGSRHQQPGIKQISLDWLAFHCSLPLKFRRQPFACPARVSVCFKKAHMTQRSGRELLERQLTPQRKYGPASPFPGAIFFCPVERRSPAVRLHRVPSGREPQLGLAIAAIGHELRVLAAGHKPVGQSKGLQPNLMARHFVIEAETVAGVPRFFQAALKLSEICRPDIFSVLGSLSPVPCLLVIRPQRIGKERIQNVGQQQLLVLLLVVCAELDASQRFWLRLTLEEPFHRGVHMLAITSDFIEARARKR